MPSMLRLALPMASTLLHSISVSSGCLALQQRRSLPECVSDICLPCAYPPSVYHRLSFVVMRGVAEQFVRRHSSDFGG